MSFTVEARTCREESLAPKAPKMTDLAASASAHEGHPVRGALRCVRGPGYQPLMVQVPSALILISAGPGAAGTWPE